MDLLHTILSFLGLILDTISTPLIFILLIFLLIIYHFFLYSVRDRKYLIDFRKWYDTKPILMKDFKEFPLINFIIPAWKEGEIFRECLLNFSKLKYPNFRVIVNAGGSKETLEIANSFKNNEIFTIIHQEKGGGKIKAINDCFPYIKEGLLFIMDADIRLLSSKNGC
jgi:cellulose synthase/poly-beta-1,6-N-acetylglucosamine synthase-like glycosyltransferase